MPVYNVPIIGPDGGAGTIKVNARDPESAVENASQGGNTPTGGATQTNADPNSLDSQSSGGGGGGGGGGQGPYNTGNAATVGASTANPGTAFGYGNNTQGDDNTDRTKAIYEGRDNETLQDWMGRVFRQGTRDFGGALSPDADNPYGRTPYANWFQNRYSDVVPANIVLSQLLNNTGGAQDFAPGMEAGMKDFMSSGTGRGFGTGTQGAGQNLGKLNDLLNSFMNGDQANLSPDQVAVLGSMNDSPQQQMAMVNAQLSGGMGANPFASQYVTSLGSRLQKDYYDDIVGNAPNKQGSFLQNLMQRLNMAPARQG